MPRLRIGSLEWGVGIFCALLGALTLVAPHQFDYLVSGLVLRYLYLWGSLCLIAGFALISLPVFFPKAWISTTIHLFTGLLLLFMVAGFVRAGGYIGAAQYGLLGLGTILAGFLPYHPPQKPTPTNRDLLSLVLGLTQIVAGLRLLLLDRPLNPLLYADLSLAQETFLGWGFLLTGAGLVLVNSVPGQQKPGQQKPERQKGLGLPAQHVSLAAYLAASGMMFAFLMLAALPQRAWISVLYFLGFGFFLLLRPWSKIMLRGISQKALRVRLALALSVAAAIPLIIAVGLTSNLVEKAVETEIQLQTQTGSGEPANSPAVEQQEALAEMATGLVQNHPLDAPLPTALAAVYAGRDLAYGILLLSLLFTAISGSLIATWLAQPLSELAHAAHQLAGGISTTPLPRSRVIEIQQLASAFNEMRQNLDLRTRERQQAETSLRRANEALEVRVAERTAEIQQANERLTAANNQLETINLRLTNSNQRLQTVLGALPVAVWIADSSGRIIQKNEMADAIWSGTETGDEKAATEPAFPNFWDSGGEPLPSEEWPLAQAVQSGEISVSKMIDFGRADGTRGTLLVSAAPIPDENGNINGAVAVAQDITQQKLAEIALRESEARERARAAELEAILAAVPAVVWIAHDPECRYVTVNQARYDRRRLYGWEEAVAGIQDESTGESFRVYLDGVELKPNELPLYLAASRGESVLDFEEEVVFENGDTFRLYGNVTPLLDENGGPRGAVGAFVDITRRYQAEQSLQKAHTALRQANEQMTLTNSRLAQANEQLQVELNERKRAEQAVKAYARQLERANRELKDFTFIASHDLQEPLRKVRAFGDRVKNKYAPQLGEDGVDYLERMSRAAERMQIMLNDLLSYSRITTKVRPFAPVDLGEEMQEVLSDLEFLIERSKGCVEVGELPVIEGDPLQLRQLLQNLITNGLKFSKPGEPPVVKVHSKLVPDPTHAGGKIAEVIVEDNGIGFDEVYLDRIFQPFQRLHGRSEYEGSGIGLAICRKVVERHQGSITAKSTPGVGSTFSVFLPLQQKEAQENVALPLTTG